MNKTLRAVSFFGIFGLLLAAGSMFFAWLAPTADEDLQSRHAAVIGIQEEAENTIDLLVLGDSETYTSISPMQLYQKSGITSYICGQSQQRVFESYDLLKLALETQSPKVVILETNALFRCKDQDVEIEKYIGGKIYKYMPIFRYHYLWKMPFEGNDDVSTQYKGFRLRDKVKPYTGKEEYMVETDEVAEIPEWNQKHMEDIIALCDEKNIELVLVSVPSPRNYNYKEHNALTQYAKEKNLTYLDMNMMNQELGMDWAKDTMDKGDHLNIYGAVKVTDYLCQYLLDNYEWEDHRNDERYQEWDALAKEYEKRVGILVAKNIK